MNAFDSFSFSSFIITCKLNFEVFYDKVTFTSSQICEMNTINLETHSHRSIPHSSNLGREYHVLEDEVNVIRDFTHQNGSTSIDHINFDENMIAVHKRFRGKIYSLLILQMCNIFQESYPGIHVMRHFEGPVWKWCMS